MSGGNDYNFDQYLNWRGSVDYYRQDPLLQDLLKHYSGEHWQAADRVARRVSVLASGRWNECAEIAARPENHPRLQHFDAHHRRIDRIHRAAETLSMEREIFGLGLFSDATDHWQKLIQLFLIYQNGEASICCPLTCTEGLVAMLERYADSDELEQIRMHLRQGCNGEFAIAAQFLSEIQGGSDVNANRVEAVKEGDKWRIYGNKFFCSAAHADYFLLSAKAAGSEQISAFLVPAWLPGNKARQIRNGHRIERLKWKMGTCELATAEIEFDAALAYPVGPMDRGLSNIVELVLSCSRITVGIFSAAIITRAAREATEYARFRQAFGRSIGEFPLLGIEITRLQTLARQSCAGVFRLAQLLEQHQQYQASGDDSEESRKLAFDIRLLIMLQKITTAGDSVDALHTAISVFGGHGVIEDFSVLPRLLRDAMVNELWEGPRNVLLAQLHRDMRKAKHWYPAVELVSRLLGGADVAGLSRMGSDLDELLELGALDIARPGIDEQCQRWQDCCRQLTHNFQRAALDAVASQEK